ncbi:hypothetical protein K9L97_04665 [Candidatus Woesearchaeota archaeon]|nr:hypothetical protein [Candidatus Woesearchaeota archaeon]
MGSAYDVSGMSRQLKEIDIKQKEKYLRENTHLKRTPTNRLNAYDTPGIRRSLEQVKYNTIEKEVRLYRNRRQ